MKFVVTLHVTMEHIVQVEAPDRLAARMAVEQPLTAHPGVTVGEYVHTELRGRQVISIEDARP